MGDRYFTVCHCGRAYCPYPPHPRHRKEATVSDRNAGSFSLTSTFIMVAMLALVVLHITGVTPWWVFWSAWVLYGVRIVWLYGPRKVRD